MTAWRAVAEALKAEAVPHIFGLPGNPLHLVDDVVKHTDIKNVLVRHEHSGVACAYAYARLTGRPAVCFGNPGPGITNMVTGLLEATSGCLPVICIANGVALATEGKGAFQELDSVALMRPVTKWAVRPTTPESIPWVMQRAFSLASNGKPGAVFIDIPSDIGLVEVEMPGANDKAVLVGPPIKFTDTPAGIYRRPPKLGEHTDEVLAEVARAKEKS